MKRCTAISRRTMGAMTIDTFIDFRNKRIKKTNKAAVEPQHFTEMALTVEPNTHNLCINFFLEKKSHCKK